MACAWHWGAAAPWFNGTTALPMEREEKAAGWWWLQLVVVCVVLCFVWMCIVLCLRIMILFFTHFVTAQAKISPNF